MTYAINLIILTIMTLADLVMVFIGFIDGILAALMSSAGIPPNVQLILLAVAALILVVYALRAFGGIFAGLIAVLLVLLVLNKAFPGMHLPQGHLPSWLTPPAQLHAPS